MGKIVMPKNSALLNEIEAVLKIYYEAGNWLENGIYKSRLKSIIGDDQYASSYTKKSQITSYFGFTEWEDIHSSHSRRRITPTGSKMYEALCENDNNRIQSIIMDSLENVKFGRDNCGCPESDSDVEPPAVFVRAIISLGYLTYREFAYILWKIEDLGANYTDIIREIKKLRQQGEIPLGDEATKYTDCKPIMMLVRWGFLAEDDSDSTGGKHIIINPAVYSRFSDRIKKLKIYNVDKFSSNDDVIEDEPDTIAADDIQQRYKEWLKAQIKEDGEPRFSDATVINYINALRGIPRHFDISPYSSIFEVYDIDKLNPVIDRIVNAENYNEVNRGGGRGALQAGLKTYQTFVEGNKPIKIGKNILLYGVPGCGKSFTIKRDYCDNDDFIERVVFHPDYTYSDFIGQILPKITDGNVSYEFEMGPFTRILKNAYDDPNNNYYLIVEEINRGNAPAIFGDIFQLLDRDANGTSEYGVTNENMAKAIFGSEEIQVKIPSNLFILATMNTADQNVFTLDTAFKRRWNMESIKNDIDGCDHANTPICDTEVTWVKFATEINDFIIEDSEGNLSSEDNRLGAWFVKENDLHNAKGFAEKVLMYLWNDAFKFSRDKVFKSEYKTLDDVIDGFIAHRFCVFTDTFSFANKDVVAPTENDEEEIGGLSVDTYLEGKDEQLIVLYNALYDAVNTKIDELNAYTVPSLNYIGFTAPRISKRNFCDVMFQRNRLVVLAETPSEEELLSVGEQLEYDGHKNHYFRFFINNATEIENAVKILVDSYNQLKIGEE